MQVLISCHGIKSDASTVILAIKFFEFEYYKTPSNLTVLRRFYVCVFALCRGHYASQSDIRRTDGRADNKAWDFSRYWEINCVHTCRIVRRNPFD